MQIADTWILDMPQQFQGKHNIEVLVKAFAKQMQELDKVFRDLCAITDIDSATGKNLDNVGTIIPLTRKEAGELAGIGDTEPVMSDERYRQFLLYKNLVNTNECTYYDLMEGLALLWDVSPIYYIEDPDMPATIILTMPFLKPGGGPVRLGDVPMVKPAGVRIEFQYLVRYAVETLVKWAQAVYSVPLCNQLRCGQHPRRGSLGKITLLQTEIGIEEMRKIFEQTKTGTIRVGGKLYDSTIGETIAEDVEIAINADYQIEEVVRAGRIVSGQHPIRSVNGFVVKRGSEVSGSATVASVNPPKTGTYPARSSGGVLISDSCSIRADPVVHVAAVNARRCGTGVCGNKTK